MRSMKRDVVWLLLGALTLLWGSISHGETIDPESILDKPLSSVLKAEELPDLLRVAQRLMTKDRFEEALAVLNQAEAELIPPSEGLKDERAKKTYATIALMRILSYGGLRDRAKAMAEYNQLKAKNPAAAEELAFLFAELKPPSVHGWSRYLNGPKGPYRGKVIDAETKAPISGAVVLVYWYVDVPGFHMTSTFYDAREVLTDANGEFFIDVIDIEGLAPELTRAPQFIIFKPAYGYFPRYQLKPRPLPDYVFSGKGHIVELPQWKTKTDRLKTFPSPPSEIPDVKMPELLKALNEESQQLGLKGRYHIPGGKP